MTHRKATKRHREVFTRYLRTAERGTDAHGRPTIEDWQEWLDWEGLMKCEFCGRYGARGVAVTYDGHHDACETGRCALEAAAARLGLSVQAIDVPGRGGPGVRVAGLDGRSYDYCDNNTHTAIERAVIHLEAREERGAFEA